MNKSISGILLHVAGTYYFLYFLHPTLSGTGILVVVVLIANLHTSHDFVSCFHKYGQFSFPKDQVVGPLSTGLFMAY